MTENFWWFFPLKNICHTKVQNWELKKKKRKYLRKYLDLSIYIFKWKNKIKLALKLFHFVLSFSGIVQTLQFLTFQFRL